MSQVSELTKTQILAQTSFPRKPLLDRVIVREIPIAEYYEQPKEGEPGYVPLGAGEIGASSFKERSDRGIVVAVSKQVEQDGEIAVNDTVFFDEFALCDPVFLNPAHKNRTDLPRYWQMRVADLKGVSVFLEPPTEKLFNTVEVAVSNYA